MLHKEGIRMYDKAIINGNVYLENGFAKTNIYIQGEKIALISDTLYEALDVLDAKGLEVLPGLIDPHVHFDLDLGFIRSKDTFKTGSKAAAYGGVTTIIDFLEPVDSYELLQNALSVRLNEARQTAIDYTFHACIKAPKEDLETFVKTVKLLGLKSIKFFTTYSESNRKTPDEAIKKLLDLSAQHNILLLGHLEDDTLIHHDDAFTYKDLLKSRPSVAETVEALKMIEYLKHSDGKLYMVHVSSGNTVEAILENGKRLLGLQLFLESCPQYFTFTDKVLNQDNGMLYTLAPPMRSKEEQALLFKRHHAFHTFATDHCAFNTSDKNKNKLSEIPLGIGGIEFSFGIMRNLLGDSVINKMTKHVADIFGIKNKGQIKVGHDADIMIFKPSKSIIKQHHGGTDYSPYIGVETSGYTIHTMVRGNYVIKNREYLEHQGKFIKE